MAEEGTNLLTSGIGGCERGDLVRARLAELVLFVPEASPPAVIALPSAKKLSPLLAAIEEHRGTNLAMAEAVGDYVEAEASSDPDKAHLLDLADRASEVEAAVLNALVALAPASAGDAHPHGLLRRSVGRLRQGRLRDVAAPPARRDDGSRSHPSVRPRRPGQTLALADADAAAG